MKPLIDLLYDWVSFYRNTELETVFQRNKTSIAKDVTLMLPNTNNLFFITVDSSLNAIG